MKKILFSLLLMFAVAQVSQAQEEGKFRVGLDLGYTMPDGGGGVLIAIEPKYNIADNMNIGLRFESAAMAKNVTSDGVSLEASLAASGTYSGTFDYYFTSGSSSFAPFMGAGIGYSSIANIDFDESGPDSEEIELDGKFGGLIRAGFELGKLRLAASYNLIGKSDLGEGIEVKNSYLGISLGFYLGGGKWKK
ncbi:outer membrane beta-barrel protein [Muricauda sp. HICW]|uniref:Outer membrane beta-barrel protein n=1 Tax=Flagellimonas chongwuensis TaxID=2697365 RepID=A0A850NFI1_9FLAO|nr:MULTISPECIES: outer membrane beta-barrel protein [Allomuricauda]NVN18016.1 outer membrane beta-barrel protein [Allomuricauda chongwuensis]